MRVTRAHLQRNRRLILLFGGMVVLPAAIFAILIIRAVQTERVATVQQRADRQRNIAQLVQTDLNGWLFSTGPQSGIAKAVVRFEVGEDRVVFPGFQLSLPITGTPRPQPLEPSLPASPTAESLVSFYYPRIVVFLRDVKSRAQYFQRLRAMIVRLPESRTGYVITTDEITAHVNQRLAQLAGATNIQGTFSIADIRDNTQGIGRDVVALDDYPFFQVHFAGGAVDAENVEGHGFAYVMSLLVGLTILGSAFLYRAMSQEVRLSQLRADFVSAVSHEFRSPLSSIMALSERLASARVANPERMAEYHQIISRDAQRLSTLVTRLLDFAQVEEGKKTYLLERTDLVAVARDAIDASRDSVRRRDLALAGDAGSLWVHADRVAIQHCIQNLIENAFKYSPPGSPIHVACAAMNGSNVVDVTDQGVGIPPWEHEKIFEKFYRGAQTSSLGVQGVGIGLSLVARVVESHGGSVEVDSQPGRGSRFRLVLPKAEDAG